MGRRRQVAMVAVSVAALVGIASGVSQGGARIERTTAIAQLVKKPIRGTVQAVQRGTSQRARLFVSLHGLEPNTDYLVVSANRPCSQGIVDAADYVIWRSTGTTQRDDLFGRTRVSLSASLATARSIRVYEGGTISSAAQRACTLIDVWEHA